jgi:hypothetical protein
MRGAVGMVLTFVIVVVVMILYVILGRSQMTALIHTQQAERDRLEAKRTEIARYQTEMRDMTAQLPQWRAQLTLFKRAIPEKIDDDKFISAINNQLALNKVKLLNIDVVVFGSWLKDVDEQTIKALSDAGLDVDTMRRIQVAYFNLRLSGNFKDVITSFENLKRSGRLYTIDLVTSEGQGGGGAVTEVVDPSQHPLMVSGAIFYGVPGSYVDPASLDAMFASRFTGPLARSIYQNILQQAQATNEEKPATGKTSSSDPASGAKKDAGAASAPKSGSYSSAGAAPAQGV